MQKPGAQKTCCRARPAGADDTPELDDPSSECPFGQCPYDTLPAHLHPIYSASMACIEDTKKTEGEGSLAVTERTFAISIERFRFFWWLFASHYEVPDSEALSFWDIVAVVRQGCEDAQGLPSTADHWAKRRKQRAALERLQAAGAPIPPELAEAVNPTPRFKLKTRAERAAEAAARGEVIDDG